MACISHRMSGVRCPKFLSDLVDDKMLAAAQNLLNRVGENQFLVQIAQKLGLDAFVVVNQSQRGTAPSPILLKAVIGAIIGASWIDSKRDVPTIQALIKRLGYTCRLIVLSC